MIKRGAIFILILLLSTSVVYAKTDKFGTWLEFELTKTFLKNFEFSIIPDVRLQDDFTVDKYQFDAKLGYEPFKFLSFAAAYRIKTNVKDKGNVTTNRFVFDVSGKEKFGRFNASLRARLTNYSDDDDVKITFIRPRVKVGYDIKGNKFAPYTSYELFQSLNEKELKKGRFDIGFTRKMGKFHRIGIYYRLQHYYDDRTSINILGIDYRFKI